MSKKYKSPSTQKDCSAPQYITELLMTRAAQVKGEVLPFKFWSVPPHKQWFLSNIMKVNGLIAIYSPDDIIMALHSKRGKKVYSINCPFLDELVEEEQRKAENVKPTPKVDSIEPSKPMKSFGKTNKLDRLRGLE